MEMEQWDNGQDLFQPNNFTVDNNGDSSYHRNDDGYNNINHYNNNNNHPQNDYFNEPNYNDNSNNYNNPNYNNRNFNNRNNNNRHMSRQNNYRSGNYHRNQYHSNRGGYNNRNRGRYRQNNSNQYNSGYNSRNNYHHKPYHNNYQQKRNQYQPKRQYQAKHTQHTQPQTYHPTYQDQHNQHHNVQQPQQQQPPSHPHPPPQVTSNQSPATTATTATAANPSNDSTQSTPSRPSRPKSDHRFGRNKKKRKGRQIEDDLDFEVNDNENDDDQTVHHDASKIDSPPSNDYRNDLQHQHQHQQQSQVNDSNKTHYADDSEAQLYQTNTYSFQPSFQSQYAAKPKRRQNTLELENLSARAKEMAIQLKNGKYDCMVCQSVVGKKGRIWTCKHCYTMFHITCVNKWARAREQKDAETEQRAIKPDHQITKIRCPACNFVDDNFKFDQYKCFCGKVIFDHEHRASYKYASSIPHSCGDICGTKRGTHCPHTCPSECHPGPCEPCKLPSTRKSSCPCGKMTYSLLCGEEEKENEQRLCQQICGKLLKCGNHRCQRQCHHGECKQCEIKTEQQCFCGKTKKLQPCGTGIKVIIDSTEEEEKKQTVLKFSCNKICNKSLACKHHKCTQMCHNGSCSVCPRKLETPTRCACGKSTFKDIVRKSCMDKLPVCNKKCGRMLGCGQHFCKKQCHDSKCQLCMLQIKKRCRCAASEKKYKCHDYQKKLKHFLSNNPNAIYMEGQDSWIRCGKKCKRVKSCGKHVCAEICCIGRNNRTYFEGHQCREFCSKPLECGRHKCSSYCHRGRCNPCGVTYRNGVQCACGNVYVPGPFQCGTKNIPICQNPCDKILPCGHRCVAKCHHGDCPPCNRLCSKPCISHDILVHNMPCHVENRSCGNPCGKLLDCGLHRCNRTCHGGVCKDLFGDNGRNNGNQQIKGCGQVCGSPLKCGHTCFHKCHAFVGECNAEICKEFITVKCKCGNTSDVQYCRGRTEYELKAVPCTEHCQIAERNKRFAKALNIDVNHIKKGKGTGGGNDNDTNEQKDNNQNNKMRIPFAAAVLKRIIKWMHDDKSHTKIVKENKNILSPKFVYYLEGLLTAYISDKTNNCHVFKNQYPDITVLASSKAADPLINLKPMSSEQRFIVYSMITHYNLRCEKKENGGKHGSSYLELSKTKHCSIPDYLLSTALIEYQLHSDEIDTLESMPPSNIIVIDNSEDISSSVIQDRLLAWTGDYRMWRNKNEQLFIVFTDESSRNSAMTEMRKFGARKATQSDSINAQNAHKKHQKRKQNQKKLKAQQQNNNQQQQPFKSNSNSGWVTKGDAHAITVNNMPKAKSPEFNIKMNNRFG